MFANEKHGEEDEDHPYAEGGEIRRNAMVQGVDANVGGEDVSDAADGDGDADAGAADFGREDVRGKGIEGDLYRVDGATHDEADQDQRDATARG